MTSRLGPMLDELEVQVLRVREHEAAMQLAFEESGSWSRADDREWVHAAAVAATTMRLEAEGRLARAHRIVDRAKGGPPERAEARACVGCGQPIQSRQLYVIDGPLHIACSREAASAR